jgi:hypothetical protein
MIISVDSISTGDPLALRRSRLPTALDHWPTLGKLEAIWVSGTGADASSKPYPAASPDAAHTIVSYGYKTDPWPISEGYFQQLQPLTVSDRTLICDTAIAGGFFIMNHQSTGAPPFVPISSKMRITGPARGCVTKHVGFLGVPPSDTAIGDPVELVPIDLKIGDTYEIPVESGGSTQDSAIIRVFWCANEAITGFPRNLYFETTIIPMALFP